MSETMMQPMEPMDVTDMHVDGDVANDVDGRSDGRLEADEEGHLRLVASHSAKVKYVVGLSTPGTTRRAWQTNPLCAHCDTTIAHPEDGALVIMPDKSHRIAHRGTCFVMALIETNPAITTGKTAAALGDGR